MPAVNVYILQFQGYHLDFYLHDDSGSDNNKDIIPRHVGQCLILPVDVKKSKDTRTAPITSLKHKPLGQIKCKSYHM